MSETEKIWREHADAVTAAIADHRAATTTTAIPAAIAGRVPPPRKAPDSRVTFPLKLHHALDAIERDNLHHIFSWLPHGRAVKIHDSKLFSSVLARPYFNTSSGSTNSLRRQLCLYGFGRISSKGKGGSVDGGSYHHPLFLRGRLDLARRLRPRVVQGRGGDTVQLGRKKERPEMDPDFYAMPPVEPMPLTKPTSASQAEAPPEVEPTEHQDSVNKRGAANAGPPFPGLTDIDHVVDRASVRRASARVRKEERLRQRAAIEQERVRRFREDKAAKAKAAEEERQRERRLSDEFRQERQTERERRSRSKEDDNNDSSPYLLGLAAARVCAAVRGNINNNSHHGSGNNNSRRSLTVKPWPAAADDEPRIEQVQDTSVVPTAAEVGPSPVSFGAAAARTARTTTASLTGPLLPTGPLRLPVVVVPCHGRCHDDGRAGGGDPTQEEAALHRQCPRASDRQEAAAAALLTLRPPRSPPPRRRLPPIEERAVALATQEEEAEAAANAAAATLRRRSVYYAMGLDRSSSATTNSMTAVAPPAAAAPIDDGGGLAYLAADLRRHQRSLDYYATTGLDNHDNNGRLPALDFGDDYRRRHHHRSLPPPTHFEYRHTPQPRSSFALDDAEVRLLPRQRRRQQHHDEGLTFGRIAREEAGVRAAEDEVRRSCRITRVTAAAEEEEEATTGVRAAAALLRRHDDEHQAYAYYGGERVGATEANLLYGDSQNFGHRMIR